MKRICLGVVLVYVALLLIAPPAAAQSQPNPCLNITTWWITDPLPAGYFYYGTYPGAFVYLVAVHGTQCSPPPECPCSAGASAPTGGWPVYLANGDTYIEQNDISLPGLGGGLSVRRTWNSVWPANEAAYSIGLFGPNWRSTYEERVFMGGDNYLRYARSDGGFWAFGLASSGSFVPVSPANLSATLTQTASYWLITFKSGEQRHFDLHTGLLTAIVDRNGNTTQLAYDGTNRLTSVTDPASRHLYFNYNGSSLLVSSITSDFGVTYSYGYDAQNRLYQVTKPDLTTITYTYNLLSQITQVTDSDGKVLETHTYDSSGRGLTASQANGVNAITLTYP